MNYSPTRNTKQSPIAKDSAIGKSKAADLIGYWLYRFIRLFKKSRPEPNGHFLLLCSKIPYTQKRYYWNKKGVECVDFEVKGSTLIAGFQNGYVLLRLHNGKQAIDKAIRLNVSAKGLQETLGLINSMVVSLNDKVKKA
ncbi:MAG: hypothetical protein V4687_16175 [Bacteroidota bacterium]